jgi:hypothetical protein
VAYIEPCKTCGWVAPEGAKPGEAYMPVPRCETCKHADRDYSGWTGRAVLCTRKELQEYGSAGECGFYPPPDFGCALWEAKC